MPRKKPKEGKRVGTKPDDKRDRARDDGSVVPLGVEVSAEHYAALDKVRKLLRWTKRTAVEASIEALAKQHGQWPPPKDE